jgi:hypothetical protein
MPRFVLLLHLSGPRSRAGRHWDFMLEKGNALRTWALDEPPTRDRPQQAEALPDHRPEYLTYEGPLSDDRGSVTRQDEGTAETIAESDGRLVLELHGRELRGRLTLERIDAAADPQRWRFELSDRSPTTAG